MTPEERDKLHAALIPHFGQGASNEGIGWLVGIIARIEECERRIAALEHDDGE